MNTTFVDAVKDTQQETTTENGMKTYTSSLNANVDFFFTAAAKRGQKIESLFARAYAEDRQLSLRNLAWLRDVRGGAGERQLVRDLLKFLEINKPLELVQLIPLIPVYGRWDDLLTFTTPAVKAEAYALIKDALLVKQDGLCAKWMPRKGSVATELRNFMGLTPKGYRKTLVTLTKVVETQMCANDWTNINYEHVPSVAAARYQRAFQKHDETGYGAYKAKLTAGEAKVNAGAVYPYDIVKSMRFDYKGENAAVQQAQWDTLPNYVGDASIIPVVDVSGSMGCAAGNNKNVTCMDVAVSLGLYLSEKNTGAFKDLFLTFSSESRFQMLSGSLRDRFNQLSSSEWGMSTNIESAFNEILRVATKNNVPADQMPKNILILSDMEFNGCVDGSDAMGMIRDKYSNAGYELPGIIFWNIQSRSGNSPVRYDEQGTALISGFSPAIMESVLKADNLTPVSVMLETLNNERYSNIQ